MIISIMAGLACRKKGPTEISKYEQNCSQNEPLKNGQRESADHFLHEIEGEDFFQKIKRTKRSLRRFLFYVNFHRMGRPRH